MHRRHIRADGAQGRRDRETGRRSRVVQGFPSEEVLIGLVGATCRGAGEDWFSRRYMDPSAIEGLWERQEAPAADLTAEQVSRARARIVALSTYLVA